MYKELFDLVEQGRRISNQLYNFYAAKKIQLNKIGYDLVISDQFDYNEFPLLKIIEGDKHI